jgi:uncharacterized protein YndB with AHSA1/START domain
MSKEINATLHIPGKSPDDLWALLSDATALTEWFCEHAEVDFAGGRFSFWGKYTPDTPGLGSGHVHLVAWEASEDGKPGRLDFTWRLRGQDTSVEIAVEEAGDGTDVTVHHGALNDRLTHKAAIHDFWYTVLENLRLFALTGRPQDLPEYGSHPGASLRVKTDVAAKQADIFRYLAEPEYVAKVWEDKNVAIDLKPGGTYNYGWEQGGPRQVVAVDAPRMLSFTWRYPPETEDSVVTWRLDDSADGGTQLSLEHKGFSADHDDEEYRAGWFSFLAIIKGIIELGDRWSRVQITGSEHGDA